MKLLCKCGAKYALEVTPEQVQQGFQLICQSCGRDLSSEVQAQIALSAATPLRPAPPQFVACPRHPSQTAAERCRVCGKPICPQCMRLYGYVCSGTCQSRAELTGLQIPVYEFQEAVQMRKYQRRLNRTIFGTAAAAILILSAWLWYALVASQPRPVYTKRFPQPATAGVVHLIDRDGLLTLHGGTLTRHDLKTRSEVWSISLGDKVKLLEEAQAQVRQFETDLQRAARAGQNPGPTRLPTLGEVTAALESQYRSAIHMEVRGANIWLAQPDRIIRLEWATGKTLQELPLAFSLAAPTVTGDELFVWRSLNSSETLVLRVDLKSGSVATNRFASSATSGDLTHARLVGALNPQTADRSGTALDPNRIAAQAKRLPVQGRLALPATISIQQGQNRLMQEIDEQENGPRRTVESEPHPPDLSAHTHAIATRQGPAEFTRQMIEERIVMRPAMKEPPKKSALDGPATASATIEAANELLNALQRERGGAMIAEDESIYRVSLRTPGGEWRAEVSGPPTVFALETLNLVIAGKRVIALDSQARLRWEHTLNYRLGPEAHAIRSNGDGNCGSIAEHAGTVYIADQGVLTALNAAAGEVKWRLPSVGVSGLFFDSAGMMYVNTTSADPDSVKYSRQIDVLGAANPVILKLDAATGTILWRLENRGLAYQLAGKSIYTLEARQPDDHEDAQAVLGLRPAADAGYFRLRRLRARDGGLQWDLEQQRGPLAVEIVGHSIQLLFPRELQVLRFFEF